MKHFKNSPLSKPLFLLLCLFSLLALESCASLPRFEEVYRRLDIEKEKHPEIIGSQGQLSPELTKRIMERLKKQAGLTDILERHIVLVDRWGREKGPDLSKKNYFPTLRREGNDL